MTESLAHTGYVFTSMSYLLGTCFLLGSVFLTNLSEVHQLNNSFLWCIYILNTHTQRQQGWPNGAVDNPGIIYGCLLSKEVADLIVAAALQAKLVISWAGTLHIQTDPGIVYSITGHHFLIKWGWLATPVDIGGSHTPQHTEVIGLLSSILYV